MPTPPTIIRSLMIHVEQSVVGWLGLPLDFFPRRIQDEVKANSVSRYLVDANVDAASREAVRIVCTHVLTEDCRYNPALVDHASDVAIRLRPATPKQEIAP